MGTLSDHFDVSDISRSSTATRLGIDNTPNEQQLANAKQAVIGMELVRAVLNKPVLVDSWLRVEPLEKVLCHNDYISWCSLHEIEVSPRSWAMYFAKKGHPKGFAIDFTSPQFGTPLEIVKAIHASSIQIDQCLMEGSWVHVSFDPQMRGEFLTAVFVNGVPHYSKGIV